MKFPHRRLNALTGEYILVSPHRTQRPWQGQTEDANLEERPHYDPNCYLCPGNKRASGDTNPNYESTNSFINDFSALLPDTEAFDNNESDLLVAQSEKGICKVLCFSPRHDLTLSQLSIDEIVNVINMWISEYKELGSKPFINYVQIFENKGAVMGCSNPHPHGQVWANENIPNEPLKEQVKQREYYEKHNRTLLTDYIKIEQEKEIRIIDENDSFITLVPYWATWPFETMIVAKRAVSKIDDLTEEEIVNYAKALSVLTKKYDKVFNVPFPYSAGIHQAPTNGKEHPEWHLHMHFYPPLLRSATVKKFMVGYELMATPQRDITAEAAAELLAKL